MDTLGDLIRRNATLFARRTALVFEGRRFTHAEYAARVWRLANALLARGLKQQERIAVLAKNCSEALEAFGAAEVAGFITVNLNYRLSERELIEVCRDCAPAVLIFAAEYGEIAAALTRALPDLRILLSVDAAVPGAEEYESFLARGAPEEPATRAKADDLAYIIYTSGTTGRPKGAAYDHAGFLEAARNHSHSGGARPDDVMLIVMPLFHVGAKIEQLTYAFLGGTIVMHRTFDVAAVLRSIAAERVTSAHLAPIMVQRILDAPQLRDTDTSSLRNIDYASAPMPVPLMRRALAAFGPILTQVYGMTECLGGTILHPFQHRPDGDADDVRRLSSAGQAFLGCEVKTVRPDGSLCEPGEIGEILIRSRGIMRGYWNNHAATIETLRGGWMHTQDLGYLDRDAFLFVVDRKRDMIISGGENIYSWEVEEALRTHSAVAEAAVIAVPDPQWGEAVKACIVLAAGARASAEELIDHCRHTLASYKKPRSIDFLESLPRLGNGKIDKKALRAPYWAGRDRQVA